MSGFVIVRTDGRCAIGTYDATGKRVSEEIVDGLAQIVSLRDGFLEKPNAYLMHRFRQKPGSDVAVANEATAIRSFLDYLAELRRDFEVVSDETIKAWRNRIRIGARPRRRTGARGAQAHAAKEGVRSAEHVNAYVTAVWRMYVWLEKKGFVSGVVDLEVIGRVDEGKISVRYEKRRGRNGVTRFIEACPLLLGGERRPRRETPDDADIEALHRHISGRHAERNTVILLMAEHVGARRGDVLQVEERMIPTRAEIEAHVAEQMLVGVDVVGKRRVSRRLNMPAFLAMMARDLADGPRADIVDRRKARDETYVEPRQLILSDRGDPISPNWVSNIVSDLFRTAGQERRSLHRLRATFLTRVAEAFVRFRDSEGRPLPISTIQLLVQELAGWTSLAALPDYVSGAHRRSAQTEDTHETTVEIETLVRRMLNGNG